MLHVSIANTAAEEVTGGTLSYVVSSFIAHAA